MNVLRKLDDNFEEWIMVALLVAMVCIMGVQIVARYVFSNSLTWSEELTRYLFVISGFLSASLCIKKCSSIKITELVTRLPKRAEHVVHLITDFIQLAFFAYLIPFAWAYVNSSRIAGETSSAIGIPMWIPESITIVAFVLCVVRMIQEIVMRFAYIAGQRADAEDKSYDVASPVAPSVDVAEEANADAEKSGEGFLFRDPDGNIIRIPAGSVLLEGDEAALGGDPSTPGPCGPSAQDDGDGACVGVRPDQDDGEGRATALSVQDDMASTSSRAKRASASEVEGSLKVDAVGAEQSAASGEGQVK